MGPTSDRGPGRCQDGPTTTNRSDVYTEDLDPVDADVRDLEEVDA